MDKSVIGIGAGIEGFIRPHTLKALSHILMFEVVASNADTSIGSAHSSRVILAGRDVRAAIWVSRGV